LRRSASSRGIAAALRRQADLLDLAQDAILVTDLLENRIAFWNRAAQELYGWSQEEALGQVAYELLQTRFPDSFAAVRDALARDGRWEGELTQTSRSGRRVIVSGRWALRRGEGEPSAVLQSNRDVTSEVEAREALRAAAERLSSIIDSAMDAIITADEEQRILSFNPAAAHLFHCTAADVLGRPLTDLLPARHRPAHQLQVKRFGASGATTHDTGALPVVAARRWDGTEFPVEATISQIRQNGRTLYTAIVRDITERLRAEQAVAHNEARQRAFFRDVLWSVTEGKLRLCDDPSELPAPLPAAGAEIELAPQTLSQLRVRVRQEVAYQSLSVDRGADLLTAAGEVAMNAIVHAGGGRARIHAAGGTIQVWVEDKGRGIDVERLPRAALERGFSTRGTLGHGFFLVLSTVDRAWLLTGPTGTTVVLEQAQQAAEPAWLRGVSRAA
jgi:PAS domain S-box-containing protein